jgi:hypothetical protein
MNIGSVQNVIRGTMAAFRTRRVDEVAAYFGSREEWKAVGECGTFTAPEPSSGGGARG